MGKKSDKKVKSDRVNALRKQYDAFLEEDKKRKERNEYILGRLDNMRYSSTAVQIRHKPIVYGERLPVQPVYSRFGYRPEQCERHELQISQSTQQRANQQNLQVDLPRPYLDDSSLLQEITKKYILIPKLRPALINDFIGTIPPQPLPVAMSPPQTNVTSNDDWKSKYDILEQLKRNEKEEERTSKYAKDELFPIKEKQMISNDITKGVINSYGLKKDVDSIDSQKVIDGYDLQSYNTTDTKDFTTKYEHEVPEKDMTFDKIKMEREPRNVESLKISDNKDQDLSVDNSPKSSASTDINPKINTSFDYTLQNQGVEHSTPAVESVINPSSIEENEHQNSNDYSKENFLAQEYNTGEALNVYNANEQELKELPQQEEYPVENEQPVADGENYPDPANVYLETDDYSPMQVLNPTEFVEDFHNGESTVTETKEDEGDNYPVDMINVQEFTPNDDVKLIDGVNVNPNYLASGESVDSVLQKEPESETFIQDIEQQQVNTSIEAFDAEQKEMFYSEQTEELAYDQQQAVTDTYNQEYAPTEGYPQSQDYSYYESPAGLQEQEYPAEINEHEETSTRYDQTYEQQYANYEEQQYEQEQEQQYVEPETAEGLDQTQQQYQEYEFQQPEHDTVQGVEQVLDNEQGYVENQNLEINTPDNAVKQVQQASE